ncbi:alpha/beta hydrolase, partial [Methanobacterium aggregans]
MEIKREQILGEGFTVPCVSIIPEDAVGAAVVIHGYGGSKEEQLGLAWRLALCGAATFAVDIRGHGENLHILDGDALNDLETIIEYAGEFGKVAAVGHSMGGRMALVSSAEYRLGISPSLGTTFHEGIHEVMGKKRSYRVKEP